MTLGAHAASPAVRTRAEFPGHVAPVDRHGRRGKNGFFPLPGSRKHSCWVLGGNRDTQMDVIRHQMAIRNLGPFLPGQRVEDFSQVSARSSEKHFAPPLGDEQSSESSAQPWQPINVLEMIRSLPATPQT